MRPRLTFILGARSLVTAGLALALALPALAVDEPVSGPAAAPVAQSAEAIQAPVFGPLQPEELRLGGPLEPQILAPVSELDRGSTFTDAGLGRSASSPNVIERTKLEMARAAVEDSRAAGTLYRVGPRPQDPTDLEALRAAKEALLHAPRSAPLPEQAGPDGMGGGLEPLQLVGPEALSAEELAKLQQDFPATSAPAAPAKTKPADKPAPAQADQSQEVR